MYVKATGITAEQNAQGRITEKRKRRMDNGGLNVKLDLSVSRPSGGSRGASSEQKDWKPEAVSTALIAAANMMSDG
ncbi:hypothetical protein EYF80_006761 [Liparis tanakae]|uniref:Uncharacterized protein n=1 Tax=Liparis tanakae TaxID=230148 RepID=A0A4Z2IZZ7_9TELE|nr:hypothetical protein EYF80_006761 [Liparis tanakae]